jgi:hypothetical protein
MFNYRGCFCKNQTECWSENSTMYALTNNVGASSSHGLAASSALLKRRACMNRLTSSARRERSEAAAQSAVSGELMIC